MCCWCCVLGVRVRRVGRESVTGTGTATGTSDELCRHVWGAGGAPARQQHAVAVRPVSVCAPHLGLSHEISHKPWSCEVLSATRRYFTPEPDSVLSQVRAPTPNAGTRHKTRYAAQVEPQRNAPKPGASLTRFTGPACAQTARTWRPWTAPADSHTSRQ